MKNKEKRCIIACKVLWREINYLTSKSPYYYHIIYFDQGLHNEPQKLNQHLQAKINELENEYSTILIGYGLCSNGIVGATSKTARLVFMRGHDCITFFLGSKERYKSNFDRFPGTYWYNTGWIDMSDLPQKELYERKFNEYAEKYDEETAQYLVDSEKEWLNKYNTVSYIGQGIIDETDYKMQTKETAKYLNWEYREIDGDLKLLTDWIQGDWNDERFLVVSPACSVDASFDETIIKEKI
ncbi:MAG: DUF1638 domain-containing protein [Saccharofermentanales bacterium]